MYLQLAVSSMFEPFFVLEGVGLLDSRDAIRRHGAEGSLNTERVWVVLAGSSSILSKRQNVPISHIVERAVWPTVAKSRFKNLGDKPIPTARREAGMGLSAKIFILESRP